jgi:S-adenosylmethionine:tRNA ribosyltransferase-isomerase
MQRADFHFHLPDELIAQHPPQERGDSRLLCLNKTSGSLADRHFSELPHLLQPGDLLVFNDTKVMKARLFGQKTSGGKVELLIERLVSDSEALVHIRASKSPKRGNCILVGEHRLEVLGRQGDLFQLVSRQPGFARLMDEQGHVPLPPYIARADDDADLARYQTVYGKHQGAVAAPTAGLHFTEALLEQLQAQGIQTAWVTLHVGAGTFQPVRVDNIDEHQMHSEWLTVSQTTCEQIAATRQRGGRVIAVGTTSVRSLETAAASGELQPYAGETSIFIKPGYTFRSIDGLITNFHLSESTLLMLVSALAGREPVLHAYQHAIEQKYRFFSYGDAMFIA